MIKKILKIKPSDTLFFRKGKPISGGEWSDNMLFPNPTVIWGAIYSMMITSGLIDETKLTSDKEEDRTNELDKLKVGRLFIQHEKNLYISTPLDIYKEKDKDKKGILELKPISNTFLSNSPLRDFYVGTKTTNTIENLENTFIEVGSFKGNTYQFQKTGGFTIKTADKFALEVPKIGIQRNNTTRTAEEAMLYRDTATQIKKDVSLIVEIFISEALAETFPVSNILKLGAEGKTVLFEDVSNDKLTKNIENLYSEMERNLNNDFSKFRLYIHSPTIFNSGNGIEELQKSGFEVLGMCMGKFQKIGGYDIEKNQPKPMQKAVPSGSIYFIENQNNYDFSKITKKLKKILNTDRYGFGQFQIIPSKSIN